MEQLAAALGRHGIDTGSLRPLWPAAGGGLHRLTTSGQGALRHWRALRDLVDETGHWPVLLGGEVEARSLVRDLESYPAPGAPSERPGAPPGPPEATPAALVRRGLALDPGAWLRERAAADPDYYAVPHGPWPPPAWPRSGFTIPQDPRTRQPLPEVVVALVPTTHSWEVAVHLRLGGWNEHPEPAVHVALHKAWHERYGAELVGATHDVIELRVLRPPQDREQALALALEQYVYCADIVQQGSDTIEALAAGLVEAEVWYFWWD
ncbi:MAG TPA: DUF4253 domain-containing protein [Chloroflexota bacterium]|nr:DUF4253 domain-containing protein [Chloroflexota bacterium]